MIGYFLKALARPKPAQTSGKPPVVSIRDLYEARPTACPSHGENMSLVVLPGTSTLSGGKQDGSAISSPVQC